MIFKFILYNIYDNRLSWAFRVIFSHKMYGQAVKRKMLKFFWRIFSKVISLLHRLFCRFTHLQSAHKLFQRQNYFKKGSIFCFQPHEHIFVRVTVYKSLWCILISRLTMIAKVWFFFPENTCFKKSFKSKLFSIEKQKIVYLFAFTFECPFF